jgi:hypothetical protein
VETLQHIFASNSISLGSLRDPMTLIFMYRNKLADCVKTPGRNGNQTAFASVGVLAGIFFAAQQPLLSGAAGPPTTIENGPLLR